MLCWCGCSGVFVCWLECGGGMVMCVGVVVVSCGCGVVVVWWCWFWCGDVVCFVLVGVCVWV